MIQESIILLKFFNHSGKVEENYVYQITVENEKGTFRQCKVMTLK